MCIYIASWSSWTCSLNLAAEARPVVCNQAYAEADTIRTIVVGHTLQYACVYITSRGTSKRGFGGMGRAGRSAKIQPAPFLCIIASTASNEQRCMVLWTASNFPAPPAPLLCRFAEWQQHHHVIHPLARVHGFNLWFFQDLPMIPIWCFLLGASCFPIGQRSHQCYSEHGWAFRISISYSTFGAWYD